MSDEFSLRFWGVRGSTPTPGPDTLRYGGETTCFEIRAGDALIQVDCGSGAIKLGTELHKQDPRVIDLFFTHTHLDHVCGLPFFKPAYDPRYTVNAWSGHFEDDLDLKEVLGRVMSPPVFPVTVDVLKALKFKPFSAGDDIPRNDGLKVKTIRLNHPGGACGYRFEFAGKVICIITDHEHGNPEIDAKLPDFVRNADIMVYDAMFSDDAYQKCRGWGHSTWPEAVALAKTANVKVPVLFHHDPRCTDDELDAIGAAAGTAYPGTLVAAEGMVLRP